MRGGAIAVIEVPVVVRDDSTNFKYQISGLVELLQLANLAIDQALTVEACGCIC